MMKKASALKFLLTSLVISSSAQASETLSIPYFAGNIMLAGQNCIWSIQGGVMTQASQQCDIEVPIPVSSGHTIKQISVFYGTVGSVSSMSAELKYKDLRALSMVNDIDVSTGHVWSTTTNVPVAAVASANLLTQSGFPPVVSYPDAFAVDPNRAYFVHVVLNASGQSEFFGLKVFYD